MKCEICLGVFNSKIELYHHLKQIHHKGRLSYDKKVGLKSICLKCGVDLSSNNYGDYCNKCRDRTGEHNSFYGKRHNRETIEHTKEKLKIISQEKWKNEDYRNRVIKGASKPRRESFKKEQSLRITQWYKDNPEQLHLRSEAMKKTWEDGKIEPNITSCNESKMERRLKIMVESVLSTMEVRKKTLKINDRWFYPDIIINNKFIIEFFGTLWHADPRIYNGNDIIHHKKTANEIWEFDEERIRILKEKGYLVKIVWQIDFKKNETQTIEDIKNWIGDYEKKN